MVSPSALKAQLEAKQRVQAFRKAERERAEEKALPAAAVSSRKEPVPAPAHAPPPKKPSKASAASSSSCGLTPAQIRALQSRELTPNDYDLLLRLDESVEKKNILSKSE